MKTKRGDVVLVLFPNSDLRTAKRRPALVIQRNDLNSGLSQTIEDRGRRLELDPRFGLSACAN
ncbi:MAG TPA: type II toxin-antitoxin system PemK/MazF family toxin [Candidatus Paceibacterota bacterium]|nr:type II toxin-antitoxin system PemK/MazF family toxin [Candidatus Paceibacterota bacterium]